MKSIARRVARQAQDIGNTVGTYVLANVWAVTALHTGFDRWSTYFSADIPEPLKIVNIYGNLLLANVGMIVPMMRMGVRNYCRGLFGWPQKAYPSLLSSNMRSLLLAGAWTLGLAVDASRAEVVAMAKEVQSDMRPITELVYHKPLPPLPPVAIDADGDPDLEARIQEYVDELRASGKARPRGTEDYAIYVKDLSSGKVLVDFNVERPHLAASTNKLYVLLAAESEVANGNLTYDRELKNHLERMISLSDNGSTNWVIGHLGGVQRVNGIVQSYGFEDTFVEKIPEGGRTLENKTSAADLMEFFERLYREKLPRSEDMRRILSLESKGHPDRLVDKTCIPDAESSLLRHGGYVSDVEDKTGYVWGANTNAGLIEALFYDPEVKERDVPFAVVALIEDEQAKSDQFRPGDWGAAKSETIRSISEAVFWYLRDEYSSIRRVCKKHKGVHPQ